MKKIILLGSMLFLSLSLSGCIFFHGYTPTVQQGNELIPDKVNQLYVGMSQGQVIDLMGSPVYTTTFSDNRLDYVYTYKKGSRPMWLENVIISFNNGVISNIQKNMNPKPRYYNYTLL